MEWEYLRVNNQIAQFKLAMISLRVLSVNTSVSQKLHVLDNFCPIKHSMILELMYFTYIM